MSQMIYYFDPDVSLILIYFSIQWHCQLGCPSLSKFESVGSISRVFVVTPI